MSQRIFNILWRDFKADKPNQKWTSGITYLWVEKCWWYLATVMDLYSRKIIGWHLSANMDEQLIETALTMALGRREAKPGLIVHSDRGVQYRSQKYIDCLQAAGCQISMNRKGNCWDNAPMESFYARLKVELVYAQRFDNVDELRTSLFNYIEVFYNRKRRHSANNGLSPVDYEEGVALAA